MARIVIASQDDGVLAVLGAEVAAEGHEVIEAATGKDALDLILSHPPSCIFADLSLPIFSGIELCQMLRADPSIPPTLPVILVTNEDIDPHVRDKARITTTLTKAHPAYEVRELLARFLEAGD